MKALEEKHTKEWIEKAKKAIKAWNIVKKYNVQCIAPANIPDSAYKILYDVTK